MSIVIAATNMDLTPALKDHANDRLEKLRNKHPALTDLDITLHVVKGKHVSEIKALSDGNRYYSKSISADMYNSISESALKLGRQLEKEKGKKTN